MDLSKSSAVAGIALKIRCFLDADNAVLVFEPFEPVSPYKSGLTGLNLA